MANQFLVDIHDHLTRQIEQCHAGRKQTGSDKDESRLAFYDGKLDELMKLRDYLSNAFDLHTQRYY